MKRIYSMRHSVSTHQTDEVVDADDVTLRAAAVREIGWVASFRVAALRPGAMDVGVAIAA
jgi:hypothetical protein